MTPIYMPNLLEGSVDELVRDTLLARSYRSSPRVLHVRGRGAAEMEW